MALNPHPLVRAGVGFACAGGFASHGLWPQQASFRSVVVGILGNGHQLDRIYSTWLPELWQGHVYLMVDACEHATTSLSMHRRNAKTRAARDGPVIQLVRHHTPTILARSITQATNAARLPLLQDCFASPRDRIAVSTPFAAAGARWLRLPRLNRTNTLWVKAAAFLAGMWDAFPRRRWYLKADEDTLLLPRSLARFFEACTAALPSQRPAYLGNVASTPAAGAAALP